MNDSSRFPKTHLYALKLAADRTDRGGIAGRLEHIPSGRLLDFADGPSLLDLLAREQAGGYLIDGSPSTPKPSGASH